jgi:hypothetical protein
MQIVVGANPINVAQLGRMMLAGNTGTHIVKLVKASDGLDVLGGSASIAMGGGTPGQFRYATLATPVTLSPGTTYWVLSQETFGGDSWYDHETSLSTTGAASASAVVWGTGPGAWNVFLSPNHSFVPVSFTY